MNAVLEFLQKLYATHPEWVHALILLFALLVLLRIPIMILKWLGEVIWKVITFPFRVMAGFLKSRGAGLFEYLARLKIFTALLVILIPLTLFVEGAWYMRIFDLPCDPLSPDMKHILVSLLNIIITWAAKKVPIIGGEITHGK